MLIKNIKYLNYITNGDWVFWDWDRGFIFGSYPFKFKIILLYDNSELI